MKNLLAEDSRKHHVDRAAQTLTKNVDLRKPHFPHQKDLFSEFLTDDEDETLGAVLLLTPPLISRPSTAPGHEP